MASTLIKKVHSGPGSPAAGSSSSPKAYIEGITNSRLKHSVERVEQDLDRLQVPYGDISSITINPRFTRRFGSATKSWHKVKGKNNIDQEKSFFQIEVSSDFFQPGASEQGLYENLLHEYIHTIPGCMNHGSKWQAYASFINDHLHTHVSTTSTPASLGLEQVAEDKARFVLECQNCHSHLTRNKICSLVVFPEQYQCRCGGPFKLLKGVVPAKYREHEELIPDRKYAVECDQCHQRIYRQRLSRLIQHPDDYVCHCGGHFHRIR